MKISLSILLLTFSQFVFSMQLSEFYTMKDTDRMWYLGGIYDTYLSQWNDNGKTSECLEKMEFKGFVSKLSEFITALPQDPASKERQTYDQMNVAGLSFLIISKECNK